MRKKRGGEEEVEGRRRRRRGKSVTVNVAMIGEGIKTGARGAMVTRARRSPLAHARVAHTQCDQGGE